MESNAVIPLVGSEIHGFHTMQDLDLRSMLEEAKSRWLRPNEIHAMLSNHKYFTIRVKPVTLPKSGEVVLFDRKMLRNFRKDGHNWKKKKDGKTVKEAHEHLKVGNDERIHVYYAHGLDNPTFVRRCYWLLDKTLEHIVLVHYRETQELQGSPATPANSNSLSSSSDPSSPWLLTEEANSLADQSHDIVQEEHLGNNGTVTNHQRRLHEINTLEWEELVAMNYPSNSKLPNKGHINSFRQPNEHMLNGSGSAGIPPHANSFSAEPSVYLNFIDPPSGIDSSTGNLLSGSCMTLTGEQIITNAKGEDLVIATADESSGITLTEGLQSQDSFGRWMNAVMVDSPGSVDDSVIGSTISSGQYSSISPVVELPISTASENLFTITDISPAWGFSSDRTKILVTGIFHEQHSRFANSNMYCVCGNVCIIMDIVQAGVFRCVVPPNVPGCVDLYISADGHKPISQVLSFEYRSPLSSGSTVSSEDSCDWEVFRIKMRLARLLFSSSKSLNILSNKVSPTAVNEAKAYAQKTSHIANTWAFLVESIQHNSLSLPQAQDILFDLALRNKLQEWLLERIIDGRKTSDYDDDGGLGVIHLCAILGYTWAVYLYSKSDLSIDFRDKHGWTALHWAAYFGREKMVAALLSAGAKANLVTDPTPENPGGYTASDIASRNGYDGLAAYLAEKGLIKQFEDMIIAGNASGSLQSYSTDSPNPETFNEEELYLKDTLAAYRTAADAAARIHSAFREHTFKMKTKSIQDTNPEAEARAIVAAMKIQHAYRSFETRKKIAAAARIQTTFRTWKIRKDFLHLRRQTIKIQALFRGHRERRHYSKIVWSVGVVEKAVLRWRLRRKGFRGLQVNPVRAESDRGRESDTEEDFFRASRKQAEDRVERSVVKVQAMFRSKQAQMDYQRMKLAHDEAKLEYEGFGKSDINMDR